MHLQVSTTHTGKCITYTGKNKHIQVNVAYIGKIYVLVNTTPTGK